MEQLFTADLCKARTEHAHRKFASLTHKWLGILTTLLIDGEVQGVTTSFGRETSERIIGLLQCFGPRFGSDIPPLFHKSFQNGDSEAEARFRLRN
jgi:hypothetical protein